MSYGLRVWDASGDLTLDVGDRTGRLYGVYMIPSLARYGSYTLTIPSFSLGAWFFYANLAYNVYVVPDTGKITFYHTSFWEGPSAPFSVVIFKA